LAAAGTSASSGQTVPWIPGRSEDDQPVLNTQRAGSAGRTAVAHAPRKIGGVVLPELVAHNWWALILNNQRAFWLKAALPNRATVAVADVTYHLED
jgi:hypothetical protein